MALQNEPGGFMLPSTLPSPPPSASSHTASSLPEPRLTALIPGSSKESALVNFVDGRLREVSARFERRFQNEPDISLPLSTNFPGYKTFSEIANDLDRIVDVIWVSATLSLQIPFLLNVANCITDYIAPYPFAPIPTLRLLQKLDYAFSSLLDRHDFDRGSPLLRSAGSRKMTTTEMVRLRGLVERTRLQLVDLAATQGTVDEVDTGIGSITDPELSESEELPLQDSRLELDVAKIYQNTLAYLGDSL